MTAANDIFVTYPCVRAMLLMFNVFFWFCGLTIVWLGIWMQTDLQSYFSISTEFSRVAPLVMITIGTIIIFVSVMSCTCIVRVHQTMLVVYGSFLIIMLFTVVTMSAYIYTYKDQLITGLGAGITSSIRNYNYPPSNQTKLIDFIQIKLQCCGSESYKDWSMSPEKAIPTSCCIKPVTNCHPEDPSTLFKIGCAKKLHIYVNSNLTLVGATASAIALFPLLGIILTFCMAASSRKLNYQLII